MSILRWREIGNRPVPGNCTVDAFAEVDERLIAKTLLSLADIGERVPHIAATVDSIMNMSAVPADLA